jgi:DNA-binding LacI/PurR family transcriptional regulator
VKNEANVTTIYDVARAAGVTAATVSYVLSGKKTVSEATRARVMKYIVEMEYRPNLVARSLTTQQTRTLGLVVPTINNPFYAEAIEATERIVYRLGFRIMTTTTQDDSTLGHELLEDLYARRVDGIIVMGGSGGLPFAAVNALVAQGFPLVGCMWDEEEECPAITVSLDFARGGQLAAEHLLGLGHQRIGIVAHGVVGQRLQHHLRVSGCVERLVEDGFPLDPALLIYGDSSMKSGEQAALQLLGLSEPPTAIFATNDLMAVGCLSAAWKLGLRVPDDLSVVGFDNIELTTYSTPPLTTVVVDRVAMMERTVELLLPMVEQRQVGSLTTLQTTLAVRQSTAPPAQRR